MKRNLHRTLRRLGLHLERHRDPLGDLAQLSGGYLGRALDGGAYHGGFTQRLLDTFAGVEVLAVEPQADSYERLVERFGAHERVGLANCALSDGAGEARLHVTAEGFTTSLLPATDGEIAAPGEREWVTTAAIDVLLPDGADFVKLDLQGHELAALRGAERTLGRAQAVLCEINFYPRYEGSCLWHEVAAHLYERGFRLHRLYEVINRPGGGLRQADGLFVR